MGWLERPTARDVPLVPRGVGRPWWRRGAGGEHGELGAHVPYGLTQLSCGLGHSAQRSSFSEIHRGRGLIFQLQRTLTIKYQYSLTIIKTVYVSFLSHIEGFYENGKKSRKVWKFTKCINAFRRFSTTKTQDATIMNITHFENLQTFQSMLNLFMLCICTDCISCFYCEKFSKCV